MSKTSRAGLYVRVSTGEQSTKAQEAELRAYARNRGWIVTAVYSDKISGAKDDRPALRELMKACRQRKIDVVVVWKFDRFARSLRHLVSALEEFRSLKVNFISATEGVDTTIPSGELVFQIFGAIAQFERALIGERVRSGLLEARRQGKKLGRPAIRVLTRAQVEEVRKERRKGRMTLDGLARKFGSSVWAIREAVKVPEAEL